VVEKTLRAQPAVESYSRRLKFGAMFSNYTETTALRLNGVYPEDELRTLPLLASRIRQGSATVQKGHIIIPELLANGMGVTIGDPVVVIATNRDGSVNAAQLVVSGVLANVTGPSGRDGYVHIEDATTLLRMDAPEISEVAVRLRDVDRLDQVAGAVRSALQQAKAAGQVGETEVHTWEGLSPFYNVAVLINMLTLSATLGLVAIVLVSIMNVMLMSVYERVKEIGTIAAMGTKPRTILGMFVIEGLSLVSQPAIEPGDPRRVDARSSCCHADPGPGLDHRRARTSGDQLRRRTPLPDQAQHYLHRGLLSERERLHPGGDRDVLRSGRSGGRPVHHIA
jgi:putative ABC transport system permease protein